MFCKDNGLRFQKVLVIWECLSSEINSKLLIFSRSFKPLPATPLKHFEGERPKANRPFYLSQAKSFPKPPRFTIFRRQQRGLWGRFAADVKYQSPRPCRQSSASLGQWRSCPKHELPAVGRGEVGVRKSCVFWGKLQTPPCLNQATTKLTTRQDFGNVLFLACNRHN